MQCSAVHYEVKCIAVQCVMQWGVLQCTAVHYAVKCIVLQCSIVYYAVQCSTLCSALMCIMQCSAVHYLLKCIAVQCSALCSAVVAGSARSDLSERFTRPHRRKGGWPMAPLTVLIHCIWGLLEDSLVYTLGFISGDLVFTGEGFSLISVFRNFRVHRRQIKSYFMLSQKFCVHLPLSLLDCRVIFLNMLLITFLPSLIKVFRISLV